MIGKIFLFGFTGSIGKKIVEEFPQCLRVGRGKGCDRYYDAVTTSLDTVLNDVQSNDIVIIAHAQVNHRMAATRSGKITNVFSVLEIINLAKQIGFYLVFFSSEHQSPKNYLLNESELLKSYGGQKFFVENAIRKNLFNYSIIKVGPIVFPEIGSNCAVEKLFNTYKSFKKNIFCITMGDQFSLTRICVIVRILRNIILSRQKKHEVWIAQKVYSSLKLLEDLQVVDKGSMKPRIRRIGFNQFYRKNETKLKKTILKPSDCVESWASIYSKFPLRPAIMGKVRKLLGNSKF